jgi:predicted PurR-regulated permease PerM
MPHGARHIALTVLAVIASGAALYVAQAFFVSLLLGILLAYTLNPLVVYLERIKVPRAMGTILVLAGVLGALGTGAYSLRGQVQTIIEQLPEATRTFSTALARLRTNPAGNLQKMQSAAAEVEKATTQAAGVPTAPRQAPAHVVVDPPGFKLNNFLLVGSVGAIGAVGQAIMVLFLTFFLLLGGDTFKRKLVRLTGPTLSNKKITVQILDDINDSIQKYLFMLLVTNVLVAILAWIALRVIGLENAGAWAVASGLLHVIPYLGPGVTAAAIGMAAFMQFDSFPMAFFVLRHLARDRDAGRDLRHHMDDRANREDERSRRFHLTPLLGMAVGRLGNAAQHPDRRHHQGRLRACRRAPTRGGAAWRLAARVKGAQSSRRAVKQRRQEMTYCIGVMLDTGMIFASDSRTNAGMDNVARFCKMTVFERRGERVIVLLSSGQPRRNTGGDRRAQSALRNCRRRRPRRPPLGRADDVRRRDADRGCNA